MQYWTTSAPTRMMASQRSAMRTDLRCARMAVRGSFVMVSFPLVSGLEPPARTAPRRELIWGSIRDPSTPFGDCDCEHDGNPCDPKERGRGREGGGVRHD